MIEVNKNRCPSNHACPLLKRCPVDAISQNGYDAPVIDHSKCIECGICAKSCPLGAVKEAVPS